MTTSVLAAGMFSLLCWILPQADGSPIWQLPANSPRGLGGSSSGNLPSSDESQPANAEPDQHPGSEGAGADDAEGSSSDAESNSDSLGGRTLVLGEER